MTIDKCLPQILPLVRLRRDEYINFFRLYRLGFFDHSFTMKLFEGDASESDDKASDESYDALEKLNEEHPFLGAPASQLISLPTRNIDFFINDSSRRLWETGGVSTD